MRALSSMSGLFVPASTTTPLVVLKPSISTSSWFRVFSRSSWPPVWEKEEGQQIRGIVSLASEGWFTVS
jgi:hypothetical protein